MQKFLFFIVLFSLESAHSQNYKVAFYNVENLFDTIDDPRKNDNDFLPEGSYKWDSKKYNEKIQRINEVINSFDKILLLGLCEVENENVVRDVIKHNSKNAKIFGLVHFESPDHRGIDVSLIYDSTKLKLFQSGFIRYTLPEKKEPSSRDILWAKFVAKKDTLHVMVNHWPSRMGGQEKSEVNRLEAAKNARHHIDSILMVNPNSKIIFMGDLNDYPEDKAPQKIAEKLIPVISKESGKYGGTYSYKKVWDVLDHIFISKSLIAKKGFRVFPETAKIHSDDFLIEEYKGEKLPFRSYSGKKYLGGYSDHLPVSIEIKF
jgi:predicted extracellular nuclease